MMTRVGIPGGASAKEPASNAADLRGTNSIPALGRSPGEGHGKPLQYSCLGTFMDRGARWASPYNYKELDTSQTTYTHTHTHIYVHL